MDQTQIGNQPNIILIAGTGQNVGKSFLGEHIIKLIAPFQPINSLKITSHFYEPTSGLKLLKEGDGWRMFEEQNASTKKDSERFKLAGATHSYYAEVEKKSMQQFANEIHAIIDIRKLILVESASFGNFITPKLAFYIKGEGEKECFWNFPYIELQSVDNKIVNLPKQIKLIDNKWQIA